MERERAKRLVVASVSTAVVFLAVLMMVAAYQMICLVQQKKEYEALCEEEAKYLQMKEETENEIDLWLQEWKIEEAARKYGFRRK